MPKKIALLIPSISSVKAFFLPLLNAKSEDVEFHLITSNVHAFEEEGRIPPSVVVHFVPSFRSMNPFKLRKARHSIKRVLNKIDADIVHAHFISAAFLLATISVKSQKWMTLHGVFHLADHSLKGHLVGLIEKFAIKRAERLEVLNRYDFDHLKHLPNVHLTPLPGVGIDSEKFDPYRFDEQMKAQIRSKLGIKSGDVVLLYVGRFTDFKGYPTVINAAKRFTGHPQAKIITCGSADSLHPANVAAELSNVINVGWSNEVENYMSVADMLLFPSKREGLPVTIMEALNMRLPVLAFPVRGVEDLIENAENGFLVEEVKESAFLDDLEKLVKEPSGIENIKQKLASHSVNYSSDMYVKYQLHTYLSKS